jgi:hypothetical protein
LKLEGKKKAEFEIISKYLNQFHEKRIFELYLSESPDFILKDNINNILIGCELTEFYNEKKNTKFAKRKQVYSKLSEISIKIKNYIDENYIENNFWFLIEIDPLWIDFSFETIKNNIEFLIKNNIKKTEKSITKYLKGIQINRTGHLSSSFTFITKNYYSGISNEIDQNEFINLINRKTSLQNNWKELNKFEEKWLIIPIGFLPENLSLEIEKFEINLNNYSKNWNRIAIYCPYTFRVNELL